MEDAPLVLPIELTQGQVRPVAYRVISKKHGLNLKSDALTVLSKFLGHHFGDDWRGPEAERSLDEITKRWKDEDRGIFVDGPALSQVIKDWLNAEAATKNTSQGVENRFEWRQYFKVVNATEQRKFTYDARKKTFEVGPEQMPKPFSDSNSLTKVFTSRYHILLDKIFRNEMFQPSGLATDAAEGKISYTISPIKNMMGRSSGTEFFLFGLLEKQQDGPWVLYDPTSSINLEFTERTVFAPDHYYTDGSFVLCHGHFLGEYFQVATMGPPPPEPRHAAQEAYGNIDFYGLNGNIKRTHRIERIDPALVQIMVGEEQKMKENYIVIAGADIFLDKVHVVDALRRMCSELEKTPPIALVLPGSFMSEPFRPHLTTSDGRNAAQIYRESMNALAEVLSQCPGLSANTKIILIPGANDPWHAASLDILPNRPLPKVFTARVERAASDVVLATNPTRLCYLSRELVFFRANLGEKLRKLSIDVEALSINASAAKQDSAQPQTQPEANLREADLRDLSLMDEDEEMAAEKAAAEFLVETNTKITAREHSDRSLVSDTQEARSVFATLLDQCHLSPFAMSQSPVMWEYDQTMSLAQWPTGLVVIDPTTPAIKQIYEGCHVINPGTFWSNSRANWLELSLSSGEFRFADCI